LITLQPGELDTLESIVLQAEEVRSRLVWFVCVLGVVVFALFLCSASPVPVSLPCALQVEAVKRIHHAALLKELQAGDSTFVPFPPGYIPFFDILAKRFP